MNKIKLSDKQKEVIEYLRNPGTALIWRSASNKYEFGDNKRISIFAANRLKKWKIITFVQFCRFDSFFELTELGKTIEL